VRAALNQGLHRIVGVAGGGERRLSHGSRGKGSVVEKDAGLGVTQDKAKKTEGDFGKELGDRSDT